MQRLLFAILLLVAGCGSGVGSIANGDSTLLKPGIYTGTITCQRRAFDTCGDGSVYERTVEDTITVTIGESGFPLWQGQQVSEGASMSLDIGGLTLSGSTTGVTVSENGVVVRMEMDMEATGSDFNRLFASLCIQSLGGLDSTTYKSDGQGGIEYTSVILLGDEFGPVIFDECTGILVASTANRDSTSLEAGIYTGAISWRIAAVDVCGDGSFSEYTMEDTAILTISESGLPLMWDGQEASVGNSGPVDLAGLVVSGTTTGVTVSVNGVIVQGDLEGSGAIIARDFCLPTLSGDDSRTYKSDGQGGIEYTGSMQLGNELGRVISFSCSGILRR